MTHPAPQYVTMQDGGLDRYESDAREIAERLHAEAVLVVVIGGRRGSGFTLKLREPGGHTIKVQIATLLVRLASMLNPDGVD